MSGGVDSSVAAALLVERGYDVTGIMLKLWRGEAANNNSGCCNLGAAEDARRVADVLGIPFYVLNFAEHFEDTVVRNFHDDYAQGRTPNPCVRCNQWVKFGALLERGRALGADVLATGHYARIRWGADGFQLLRGVDPAKDQSYVLWMLGQKELAHTSFPVGELTKSETRRIAEDLGLRTANKPDSQEICFVRDGDLGAYMEANVATASLPGPVVDAAGNEVGRHRGIARYTVGQRKGLGVALGVPVFVTAIDASTNTLHVGGTEQLEVSSFTTTESSFAAAAPAPGAAILVQHRAHGDVNPGRIAAASDGVVHVEYDRPVRALARGQSAAFYSAAEPDVLLGGGVIAMTVPARATA
ncbi:MAG: tRNA 2-thiouridine(34) synthase MnmA [Actinomycetota bacterium]|nr:tRNA 2-thiouridine(34) synthase MnmA [Actinomycetota bacterium]